MDDELSNSRFMRHVDIGRTLEMIGIEATYEGGQWKAACPNALLGHQGGVDENPSWAIRDDVNHERHGLHGCWSCNYTGNIITLVRDVLPLNDFYAARAWIQTHSMKGQAFAPISVTVETITPATWQRMDLPEGVVVEHMSKWPLPYSNYWSRRRGFSAHDASTWGVGYAASGPYAGRIWIPIHDTDGNLVNWTTRTIDDREPRYMRAPSTLSPNKGTLFGERHWGQRSGVIAVMEGELNAIRVSSVFDVPVAAFGGGMRRDLVHAAKLSTFRSMVVFADGDKTGDALTDYLRDLGLPMAVLRFSSPHDPCSIDPVSLREYGQSVGLKARL